jgi:ribulose-bisphosphate carboxylase large chain
MSSDRFTVTYRIFAGDAAEARERAEGIALEQTVEIPRDVVPAGYVEDVILGRVESVADEAEGRCLARISYSPDSAGEELAQFLNVVFGNSSIQKGIKVIGLELGSVMAGRFPGARFGIDGLRQLSGRARGGFVCPVIKPQGSSIEHLAHISYETALAGADIIKEDHGLANQPSAPFRQRVPQLIEAVAKANAERRAAGQSARALYFPTIAGHADRFFEDAWFAKDEGADGVMLMPGLYGFDAVQRLARRDDFGLPIMVHPSFLGAWVLNENAGFSHAMMFGTLSRVAGADISVFPNVGGRFGFSGDECLSIAEACTDADGHGRPILASPGGGMTPERMPEMIRMYGEASVYLLGGSILRAGDRMGETIRELRDIIDRTLLS